MIKPPPKEIPTLDYSKITQLEITLPRCDSKKQIHFYIRLYLSYIDLFTNLQSLTFINDEEKTKNPLALIFSILMNMKSTKLTTIKGFAKENDYSIDYEPIIEKFPNLECLIFDNDPNSIYLYSTKATTISPIYKEGFSNNLDYSNLYKLIHNYCNSNVDHCIECDIYE